jgi:hypothetical protein
VPNPSLTGKANFGFVSKYQNGVTTPINGSFYADSKTWLLYTLITSPGVLPIPCGVEIEPVEARTLYRRMDNPFLSYKLILPENCGPLSAL